MTKAELLSAIAGETGLSKENIERVLNSFNRVMVERLVEDKEVQVLGLGKMKVVHRAERKGLNPSTREPLVIKATDAPKFVFAKSVKEKVSGGSK